MLRVRHEPDHVARLISDASDVVDRSIRISGVAEDDPIIGLQRSYGCSVRHVVTLAVLSSNMNALAGTEVAGPHGVHAGNLKLLHRTVEASFLVTHQGARQQMGFAQYLKPVADTEHWQAPIDSSANRRHHWRGSS